MASDKEIIDRAKKLFAPELQQFIQLFRTLLPTPTYPISAEIASSLHRLKGGVGFLGFDALAKNTSRLEKLLKEQAIIPASELNDFIEACEALYRSLSED